MKRIRSHRVGGVLVALALGGAGPSAAMADWLSLDLPLTAPGTANRMTLTLTANIEMLGAKSDTQTTTFSGNLLTRTYVEFDPFTGGVAELNAMAFTGGRVALSDTTYKFNWGLFVGSITLTGKGIAGEPGTPNPPGAIVNGTFSAADHVIVLNEGLFRATATGLLAPMLPQNPYDINLADTPMPASGTGTGTLTVASPTFAGGRAHYAVTLQLPLAVDQVVFEEPGKGSMTAKGQGIAEAKGEFSRVAPAWKVNGGGGWGVAGNWEGSLVPNEAGASARFLGAVTAPNGPARVTLDGDRIVGTVALDNLRGYQIAAGSGGTLRLDNQGQDAVIGVGRGQHQIDAAVEALEVTRLEVASGGGVQFTGGVTVNGGAGLLKVGAGTADIASVLTMGSGSLLRVSEGTLQVSRIAGGKVGVGAGAKLVLPVGEIDPSVVDALEIAGVKGAWEGKVDLSGSLIVRSTAGDVGEVLGTLADQVRSARDDASEPWQGNGIGSSAAAGNPLAGIAVVQQGTDVLLSLAWVGDADLSGWVDADDYFRLDRGRLTGGTGWGQGDFNLDGVVTGDDYRLIDTWFAVMSGDVVLGEGDVASSVPEPGVMGVVALGMGLMGRRRWRRG